MVKTERQMRKEERKTARAGKQKRERNKGKPETQTARKKGIKQAE